MASCNGIHPEKIKELQRKEYNNFILYYNKKIPEKQIRDYNVIIDNMYTYMIDNLKLNVKDKKIELVVVPVKNEVVEFQKRNTNACTDYKYIYLVDVFNLSDDLYDKYGEPPVGIANDMFSHELAHCLSKDSIDYKNSNKIRPEEMYLLLCSYIDFTKNEINALQNINEIVNNNFTKEQIENLKKQRGCPEFV
jgi:hypothetical protein